MQDPKKRVVTYDKIKVNLEVDRLRKLGYPDSLIEIVEVNGVMRARPMGSKPTLDDRIRDMFPTGE